LRRRTGELLHVREGHIDRLPVHVGVNRSQPDAFLQAWKVRVFKQHLLLRSQLPPRLQCNYGTQHAWVCHPHYLKQTRHKGPPTRLVVVPASECTPRMGEVPHMKAWDVERLQHPAPPILELAPSFDRRNQSANSNVPA
jgi:hypothetical protein